MPLVVVGHVFRRANQFEIALVVVASVVVNVVEMPIRTTWNRPIVIFPNISVQAVSAVLEVFPAKVINLPVKLLLLLTDDNGLHSLSPNDNSSARTHPDLESIL